MIFVLSHNVYGVLGVYSTFDLAAVERQQFGTADTYIEIFRLDGPASFREC